MKQDEKMKDPDPYPDLEPPSDNFTYKDQVCEIIETLRLDEDPRKNRTKQSILKNRFLSEVLNYEERKMKTKKYYDGFRFIVTTGSILLPAIMSVGQMNPEKLPNNFDDISYWCSFFISLSVTISNGFLQLFSIDKNYLEFALTTEQLKTEGWQFFQLTGKYEDYADHKSAYKSFSKSVENIKRKQVEKEFQGKGDVNKNKKDKDKEVSEVSESAISEVTKASNAKIDMLLNMVSGGVQNTIGGVRSILTQEPKDEEISEATPSGRRQNAETESTEENEAIEATKVKRELLKEIDPRP